LKGNIYLGIRSQPLFVELCTLIEAAKLTDVEPQAWLANALARLQNHPVALELANRSRWQHKAHPQPHLIQPAAFTGCSIQVWILENAQAEWGTSKFPWRSRVLSG
jgi:hypothetical protein